MVYEQTKLSEPAILIRDFKIICLSQLNNGVVMVVWSSLRKISLDTFKIFSLLIFFCFGALTTLAQQKVTGKVVNEIGEGMIGVNVVVKGTSIGTITDDHGIFSIKASKGNVLVFSHVGYDSKEVVVGDTALVNVQLIPASQQ